MSIVVAAGPTPDASEQRHCRAVAKGRYPFHMEQGQEGDPIIIRAFSPETVGQLTKPEVNELAAQEWTRQYRLLDILLQRYVPIDWAMMVGSELRRCNDDSKTLARCPPHQALRSLEAVCAYANGQNNLILTPERFYAVIHAYMGHNDPVYLALAGTDLIHWLIVVDREQIALQTHPSPNEIAKLCLIFSDPLGMRLSLAAFQKRFGMTPLQWMQVCYLAYAMFMGDPNSRRYARDVEKYATDTYGVPSLAPFLARSSWTPETLGGHYRQMLADTPVHFHLFIRSAFLKYPIVDFGEGRLIAPVPSLIFRHMGVGLHAMFRELWERDRSEDRDLSHEFTTSFARHVGRALASCNAKPNLLAEDVLLSNDKSCDFLLETSGSIVLVECKGVEFTRDRLTATAMQGDSSTMRIVEAGEQLSSTFSDLTNGRFDGRVAHHGKTLVSVVVTFGEVPYVNSDWYFRNVIYPRAEAEHMSPSTPTWGLPSRPFVMSSETLELFVMVLNTFGIEPHELVQEKDAKHGVPAIGEWKPFLKEKLNARKDDYQRPSYVTEAAESFDRTLIPADAIPRPAATSPAG